MSFDINPPNKNLSNVQASAKSCPGGGGNTGYFKRDGEEEKLNFSKKNNSEDIFEKSEKNQEEVQEGFLSLLIGFFVDLIENIKNFFTK